MNWKRTIYLLFQIILLPFLHPLSAQETPKEILYVTTDKNIYTPGEIIWFSSYLLNTKELTDTLSPDLLAVGLLREDSISFSVKRYYLMANKICPGSLTIPDSLVPGDYRLVAFSNVTDTEHKPIHFFSSKIIIKSPTLSAFHSTFEQLETKDKNMIEIQVKAWNLELRGEKAKNNRIAYKLSTGWKGEVPLDIFGQAIINIPKEEFQRSDKNLMTQIFYQNNKKYSNFKIAEENPIIKLAISNPDKTLLADKENFFYWQTSQENGSPATVEIAILENGQELLTSKSDDQGMGSFSFVPKEDALYTIISKTAPFKLDYTLNKAKKNIFHLSNKNHVPKDTLLIALENTQAGPLQIKFRALQDSTAMVSSLPGIDEKSKRIVVPLKDFKKGIYEYTITDGQNKTLDRSYFLANYHKKPGIEIALSKDTLSTRDSLRINLKTSDFQGKAIESILTLYCVLEDRIIPEYKQHIDSYYYWDFWLGQAWKTDPTLDHVSRLNHQLALANPYQPSKFLSNNPALKKDIQGYASTTALKRIEVPVDLLYRVGNGLKQQLTDSMGKFYLNPRQIAIQEPNKLYLFASINQKKKKVGSSDVTIKIANPLEKLFANIQQNSLELIRYGMISRKKNTEEFQIKDPNVNKIEEVVVYAKPRDLRSTFGRNECGDYVCPYNILNCQNHPYNGRPAVKGESYLVNGIRTIYKGCTERESTIEPIYTGRTFQGMSKAELSDFSSKNYISTLFWMPYILVDNVNDNQIQFYSSDQTGKYKLIIEGVTNTGELIYAEKEVIVK